MTLGVRIERAAARVEHGPRIGPNPYPIETPEGKRPASWRPISVSDSPRCGRLSEPASNRVGPL
ncbi:hypothetical protein T31B1_15500 [Salinisphaera sp. T31B1]